MKNIFLASVWCLICLIALPQMAHAASVAFAYEGIVTGGVSTTTTATTQADFSPWDLTGERIRFQVRFDHDATDADDSSFTGLYPVQSLLVSIGPYVYSANGGHVVVRDDAGTVTDRGSPPGFGDSFQVTSDVSTGLIGPTIGDFSIRGAFLRFAFWNARTAVALGLEPPRNDVFFGDHLPLSPVNPSDFPIQSIGLEFGGGSDGISFFSLEANNVTLAPVPLPPSLFLFAFGLFGLGGLQMKRCFRV